MIKFVSALLLAFGVAALGCDSPDLPASSTAVSPPAPPEPEPIMVAGAPGDPLPDDAPPVTDVPRPFDLHDPIKGRRSREAGGYLGAVGNARFAAEYKMMLISITECLNLYWAPEGEFPKTHEEFMKEIIDFNKIKLPELPEGVEFIYVPGGEDPTKMLQVRLTPGSPGSLLPAPAPGKEHIYDPRAVAAAGGQVPPEDLEGLPEAPPAEPETTAAQPATTAEPPATGAPAEGTAEEPAAEELSPNIRERAGQVGGQADSRTEEALEGGR